MVLKKVCIFAITIEKVSSIMTARIVVHVSEFVLSVIYIVLIWPIYVEDDFVYGCLWGIGYLVTVAIYCGIAALIPAMHIACDVGEEQNNKGWNRLLSNIQWFLISVFILLIFGNTLGYIICLPIVIPNLVYLLYQSIREYH